MSGLTLRVSYKVVVFIQFKIQPRLNLQRKFSQRLELPPTSLPVGNVIFERV